MDSISFEYERFFDLTPDLLCIAGFDGYFKKINTAVSNTLGYSMEELYSRPINDFVYHEDKKITSEVRNELFKLKPLQNFENRYVCKSGEIVWLSWTSQPIEDQKLVFAIAKNITHKKHIEAERNSLLENVNRVNQNLKQLTFTTSHDLRSPVNNLLSIMQLINFQAIEDPETIELLGLLKYGIVNLKSTLNEFLDNLKQTESEEAKKETINLQSVLDHVTHSIKTLIATSQTKIESDFSTFSEVKFNKAFMESIYLNFISNSIKYSKPGVPPRIKFLAQINGKKRQLIVEDNGIGLDSEDLEDKIFGLGEKTAENPESHGVGLYLVYSRITAMGGKISVESKINEGTKFIITFKN